MLSLDSFQLRWFPVMNVLCGEKKYQIVFRNFSNEAWSINETWNDKLKFPSSTYIYAVCSIRVIANIFIVVCTIICWQTCKWHQSIKKVFSASLKLFIWNIDHMSQNKKSISRHAGKIRFFKVLPRKVTAIVKFIVRSDNKQVKKGNKWSRNCVKTLYHSVQV